MTTSGTGSRWTWTDDEADRVVALLRKWCDGNPLKMPDLERAAAAVSGSRRRAESLRDALLATRRLVRGTTRGRAADYRLVDDADRLTAADWRAALEDAEAVDEPEEPEDDPSSGGGVPVGVIVWLAVALSYL